MLSAKEDKIQGFNGHEQLTTYLYGETNEVVKGLLEQAEKLRDKIKQVVSYTTLLQFINYTDTIIIKGKAN